MALRTGELHLSSLNSVLLSGRGLRRPPDLQFRQLVWCQICRAETFNFDTLRDLFRPFVHNRTFDGRARPRLCIIREQDYERAL